jgi:hypothetical protein
MGASRIAVVAVGVAFMGFGATTIAMEATTVTDSLVCDPGGPYSAWSGCPIEFDGSASEAPGGTIVSYLWAFGDGATGQGVRPTHVYNAGNYSFTVTLTVTDDRGGTSDCSTFAFITRQLHNDLRRGVIIHAFREDGA